jgi:hypothetical protein
MHRREVKRLDNPEAVGWPPDEFSADLGHAPDGDDPDRRRPPHHHEDLPGLRSLDRAERDRVSIVLEGIRLDEGGIYFDLADPNARPFKALAGQVARPEQRLIRKKDTEPDLWRKIVGDDDQVEVVRPR